jgi:hypothetical protein
MYLTLMHKLKGYGRLVYQKTYSIGLRIFSMTENKESYGAHSALSAVTSGIPRGSVLGPILFTIYINDLPDAIENMVKLFADDTKVYATVNNTDERDSLQSDIDRLMNWSDTWLLKFNKSKCKHTHLGPETGTGYSMLDDTI